VSLDGAYDPTNVFARILRGELPCVRVYEDEEVLSFMDAFPQAPGHVLVVPKVACRNLLDVPPDRLAALMVRVQKVAAAVRAGLGADGLTVFQFNGSAGGQTVFHLHVHIVPRFDGAGPAGRGGAAGDPAQLEAFAARIRAALP
jgi:histidine triad (HIT) family protein